MPTKQRQDVKASSARATGIEATPSIIAAGVVINGDISANGEIHLDGEIIGNLACTGLTMGETSKVTGTITAQSAVIRGTVDGQLTAEDVRLEKSAVLDGDVYHKTLAVEAGARLTGRVIHGEKPKESSGSASEKEGPSPSVAEIKAAE